MDRSKPSPSDRTTTGSDFLQLNVRAAAHGRRSSWLAEQVRLAIADGTLAPGSRLPATRELAAELGVSRGVVTESYRRLAEDGLVAGRGRAGTVVLAAPFGAGTTAGRDGARPSVDPAPVRRDDAAESAFAVVDGVPGESVFEALRDAPARVDLTPGVPDLSTFPRTAWLRAERTVLADLTASAFGYGDPRGAPVFRTEIAHWLARYRGIRVDPAEVIVVSGVAQGLALLAQVLAERGVRDVAVEDPGSLGTRQHLTEWGMRTPPVPVDAAGLQVSALAASGAPVVLLTPAHQFPTGVVLDGQRRRELLAWAAAGGLIIEDDYDAEHRYDRPPTPALQSLHPEQVCYTGSLSKTLAPALRTGWLVVPDRYRDDVVAAKRRADLGSAALAQLVLAELMRTGSLERHLRTLRRRHRRRRDAMIGALGRWLPQTRVHGAAAGLHLTVTFDGPDGGDHGPDDVALASAALERGVKVHPLSWHRQRPGPPGLVLGYAARMRTEIDEAIGVLGELAAEAVGRSPRRSSGLAVRPGPPRP
ncbi:PLP-dependent aminotransferase family protein [Nocardioides sp.]|uniref:MocR-like pyridoxine biosynthesis transcription factor PdxR n=1 Tax=Nocardioides sp. TaxID=35761 RepID=UPI002ED8AF89